MVEIIQSIIAMAGIYFIVHLVRTTGKNARNNQPSEAHRLLMEIEITDKISNILPLDLRNDVREYMKRNSLERTHNA